MATPRLIQCCCVWWLAIGTRMNMTKFVEWPVVLSVPLRVDSLYIGHWYMWASPPMEPV